MDIYAQPLMNRRYSLVCYDEDGEMIGRLNWSPEASGRVAEGTRLLQWNAAQEDAWREVHQLLYVNRTPQRHQAARQRLESVFARVEVVE